MYSIFKVLLVLNFLVLGTMGGWRRRHRNRDIAGGRDDRAEIQAGGILKRAWEQHKTNQARRIKYWSNNEPRAIPTYSRVVYGASYSMVNRDVSTVSKAGNYYDAASDCDNRGDGCWGFQTTMGCKDGLGCAQALITKDPEDADMIEVPGETVYTKKTWMWDSVPLECSGLVRDYDAKEIGECEFNCTDDLECEIYQWHDDNTCWRGKSSDCTGTKQILEGYRMRPIYWAFTKSQCADLKHDGNADGSVKQCQYNCQWDLTCQKYQYYNNNRCYRGKSNDCDRLKTLKVLSGGQKDYKFKWKTLKQKCTGLVNDPDAASFHDCKANCKNDDDCSVWQYDTNNICWRGHPTGCTNEKDDRIRKGGYRWYINNGDSEEDEDGAKEDEIEEEDDTTSNEMPEVTENFSYNFMTTDVKLELLSGDYYKAKAECDSRGDECWGFQTMPGALGTGCTGGLGCSCALILEDPTGAEKEAKEGYRIYRKTTPVCPDGFHGIAESLDGGDNERAEHDESESRTIDDCAQLCADRSSCSSFEFNTLNGRCVTYTGVDNIGTDADRLSLGSTWRSCMYVGTQSAPQCPQGYWSLGYDGHLKGADHRGVGIGQYRGDAHEEHQTAETCAQRCEDEKECAAFSFAPIGGDQNKPYNSVCTLYTDEESTPNQRWPGINGDYSQIFCKSADLERNSYLSGLREGNGRDGEVTCGHLHNFVHVPLSLSEAGKKKEGHKTSNQGPQECTELCQFQFDCVGLEYNFAGTKSTNCYTYTDVDRDSVLHDGEERDGWLTCVPVDNHKQSLSQPGTITIGRRLLQLLN